jgi:nucleotide-binding universal stress UspA family protein
MKNILVPVDFSEASKTAARFAARIAGSVEGARLFLYNMFDGHAAGSDSSPVADGAEFSRTIRMLALANIKDSVQAELPGAIECRVVLGHSLTSSVNSMVALENIDLVVMGASGATRLEQIVVGSNTMRVVRHAVCPVLVIPPHAALNDFGRIALVVETGTPFSKIPVKKIEAILTAFPGKLFLISVNHHPGKPLTSVEQSDKAKLNEWLQPFEPVCGEFPDGSFLKATNQFVIDKKVDLLLTIPHKISYINDLFHYTNTEKLGNHGHVPFIAVPEE